MTDPPSESALLLELGTATLGESGALAMPSRVRAAWRGARLAAKAFPVCCVPGDNLAIHVAVTAAPTGSALVVDVGDEPERGYWGEVLTTAAQARGLAGLVIDGGVRDTSALERLGFPAFASTVALPGATKTEGGSAGASAVVAGVPVSVDDWVVGDQDGVVVVPAGAVDDVVARAGDRAAKEVRLFEALREGATTMELLGLDPAPVRRPGLEA